MESTRIKNSGYSHHGASRAKTSLLQWVSASKSPHEDISQNLPLLRERSRDLYAGGGPLGRGAIDRLTLNAIGSGLKLNVRIDAELLDMAESESRKWAAKTEAEFDYWAASKDSDFSRMQNFYELQVSAFRALLLDGECLVVLKHDERIGHVYGLQVMLIESDRLMTPPIKPPGKMIDEGVELDTYGRPIAYWIANRHPDSEMTNQPRLEYKRIPLYRADNTRNILHLINPERISQHRGVPYLSPVIEQLKQLGRYTDAELMAAVVSGMYAVFFEHTPRGEGVIGEEEYASEQGLGEADSSWMEGMTQTEMYGAIMDLPEGVKPVGVAPNRPNVSFDAFVMSLVKQIGGCLGIPAELLFLNFTASYSASRGALLEAWKLFRYWREWFASNFCQPIYEEWLNEAVIKSRVIAPGYFDDIDDYRRKLYAWSTWTGPAQGQLDPVKEVNASILKVQHGFSTYQRETAELTGEDYDLNMKALRRERGLMSRDFE